VSLSLAQLFFLSLSLLVYFIRFSTGMEFYFPFSPPCIVVLLRRQWRAEEHKENPTPELCAGDMKRSALITFNEKNIN
jgi:hypothetical protein